MGLGPTGSVDVNFASYVLGVSNLRLELRSELYGLETSFSCLKVCTRAGEFNETYIYNYTTDY